MAGKLRFVRVKMPDGRFLLPTRPSKFGKGCSHGKIWSCILFEALIFASGSAFLVLFCSDKWVECTLASLFKGVDVLKYPDIWDGFFSRSCRNCENSDDLMRLVFVCRASAFCPVGLVYFLSRPAVSYPNSIATAAHRRLSPAYTGEGVISVKDVFIPHCVPRYLS